MNSFEPITSFTSNDRERSDDSLKDFSHLSYEGRTLPFRTSAGTIFRQYKVKDLYVIISLYDGYDYQSFSIVVLDKALRLLHEFVSPNFFDQESCPFAKQFVTVNSDTLQFSLGANDPWLLQVLKEPQWLPQEALVRMRHFWWPRYEASRVFRKTWCSIRPLKLVVP